MNYTINSPLFRRTAEIVIKTAEMVTNITVNAQNVEEWQKGVLSEASRAMVEMFLTKNSMYTPKPSEKFNIEIISKICRLPLTTFQWVQSKRHFEVSRRIFSSPAHGLLAPPWEFYQYTSSRKFPGWRLQICTSSILVTPTLAVCKIM